MPDELQVVSIPVIEQDTCAELYKEWDLLYDGEVCAGAPDQGSCNVRSSKFVYHKLPKSMFLQKYESTVN